MRRFLTLVSLLCVAIPAGISISGCYRNPDAAYCNGTGYGLKVTDVDYITLTPVTAGVSIAFGQTQQIASPTARTCKGTAASVSAYTYGTSNNQLVDISPAGTMCAGTWNRNTGGGIANYTICNKPDPLPSTNGLPYAIAYVTASANSVTSNPVQVYVHAQVTSVNLVTTPLSGSGNQCFSQGTQATLDSEACFVSNNTQYELCAPPSVVASGKFACQGGPPPGVAASSIPDCTASIGTFTYTSGNASIGTISTNTTNNQVNITAEQPGTSVITASIAGSGSSAGYFSTCPPKSISVTLANGATSGTVTQGVTQNLTTSVIDTAGNPISGINLVYQSTDPIDISAGSGGAITTNFPGVASVYAVCEPGSCNPAPINENGLYGTGLSISSNPVKITTPGTASDFVWFGAPGQSQYFVPIELLTGTVGSTVRLPFVPNSMLEDRLGLNLFFGSSHELMMFSALTNTLSKGDTSAPGVVLAVAPNDTMLLINDQQRQLFYLYSVSSGIIATYGGMGTSAAWTPDALTLYITDSSAANNPAAGITGHTDTLYVYNANTGFTSAPLAASSATNPGAQNLAITIPGVGAFLSGNPTVAHTWCPIGTVGSEASMLFYPQGPTPDNTVAVDTDVLAATTDGSHILGASAPALGGPITLSDIGVTIPSLNCLPPNVSDASLPNGATLSPLVLETTVIQAQIPTPVATVNQVVPSPNSNLAFVTFNPAAGSTATASLPYYLPGTGGAAGTVGAVTLTTNGSTAPTAPLFGAFSPDSSYFFVSTAGDNMIHYITIPPNPSTATPPVDSQQIAPNLPACTPVSAGGNDLGCTYTGTGTVVPATYIAVKPRSTT
jgi:hypothetical protein